MIIGDREKLNFFFLHLKLCYVLNASTQSLIWFLQISLGTDRDSMANIWGTIVGVSSWIIGLVIPLILGGNSIICRKAFQLGMAVSVFVFYKNGLAAIALFLAATIAKYVLIRYSASI